MIGKLLVSLAVPLALASSADMPHHRDITLDQPNMMVRVHHEPNVEFMVTNFGFFGSMEGQFPDPEDPDDYINGFEFPADSIIEYLFFGALWIGAEIDTIDSHGNPILDTLVSVGNDGWWSQVYELMPPTFGYPTLWEEAVRSDEDIHAVYYDTVTDAIYISQDPNDQRPHIPLGLQIHQVSYAWHTPGYDEYVVIDFYIENIGTRFLHNVWLGFYFNGDVFLMVESPWDPGYTDDLNGFIEHGLSGIAWIADNDGDPYGGVFEPRSVRGVIGLTLLCATEPNLQSNFNWWVSNINPNWDWGPQRVENYRGPFPGGGKGTPGGDKAKYAVMSNGERDYDQAKSALSHAEWIEPPANITDIADGYDTRFLISFGPIALLPPGHVDTLTIGILGGRNLHNDPNNYIANLRNRETDSASIAQYYANLDFTDLIAKADSLLGDYVGVSSGSNALPGDVAFFPNYPNPFNARTRIAFTLARQCEVQLTIYNIAGQRVAVLRDGPLPAGHHSLTWDAGALPSGLYFARLETPDAAQTMKMVLVK